MALSDLWTFVRKKLSTVFSGLRSQHKERSTQSPFSLFSRFIFSERHFSQNRVKPPAFIHPSRRISVMAIDRLTVDEIWQVGDEVAGRSRGPSLARADVSATSVNEIGLSIQMDPAPHPRHANICGCPVDKDEMKAIALELCARAQLFVRPTGD
jgi:hypothetical protein